MIYVITYGTNDLFLLEMLAIYKVFLPLFRDKLADGMTEKTSNE